MIVAVAEHRVFVWRSIAARSLLAALPAWCTLSVIVLWTPWRQKLLVGGMAALTLASPSAGLLALCVLTPLGTLLESITNLPYRLSESFVLAFIACWLLRSTADRSGPRMPRAMTWAGWLLGVSLAASVAGTAVRVSASDGRLAEFGTWLLQAYYVGPDSLGFVVAARLAEVLTLAAATLYVFRRRPSLANSLPLALGIGGAIAAGTAVAVWAGTGPESLVRHFTKFGYRAAHIGDPNAAGSYFALILCLMLGMGVRARSRSRPVWLLLAAAQGLGLWFAESKTAAGVTVAVLTVAAGWWLTALWSRRARLAVTGVVLVGAVALSAVRIDRLERDPTYRGGGFRSQFNATSLRMVVAHPIAGVGVGQYYIRSSLFLSPQLAFAYGHENAHNYFLQIAAELGLPGFALFALWLGAGATLIARALVRDADVRLMAAAAGASTFLATCLTGHPLLVEEAAFPFAIAFAFTVGLAGSILLNRGAPRRSGSAQNSPAWIISGCSCAAAIVAATMTAARGPIAPPISSEIDRLYPPETGKDGSRFRWMDGQFASIFIPANVGHVYIPLRLPENARAVAPMGIEAAISGALVREMFVGTDWAILNLPLPATSPDSVFTRVDLRVDRTWQPAIYMAGSADMRALGVEVGDWKEVP